MERTTKREINLIKLYEKHAVLRKSSDTFYKILNKRNNAKKAISQELNIDAQEIKRKITSQTDYL